VNPLNNLLPKMPSIHSEANSPSAGGDAWVLPAELSLLRGAVETLESGIFDTLLSAIYHAVIG